MGRRLLRLLFVLALWATPLTAMGEVNYVFYTVETLKWGTAAHQLAVPRVFPSSPEMTSSQVVAEAFHRLKSFRGAVYQKTNLTLDPNFGSTGAASVTLGEVPGEELAIIVSEVYWTLTAAGVREIRIAEVSKDALAPADVPFGSAHLIVQLWQILPPGQPGAGLVRLGDSLEPATEIRRKLDSKDKAVVAAVFALLHAPVAAVRLKVVTAVASMNLPKTDAALIPLLRDPDDGVKRAVLKGFEGTSKGNRTVLSALEQVVQSDPDPLMQSAAARILSAAGVSKYEVIILYDKLKDKEDSVVMDAIDKLSKGGKPEVAMALAGALTHPNGKIREMAMKAIVDLQNVDALRKILETEKVAMKFRNQAATIMAAGKGEDSELGLRHLLLNGATDERIAAISQVASERRYKLVPDVIGLVASDDQKVRLAAAEAVATIKSSKALEPLAAAIVKYEADKEKLEAAVISVFGGLSLDEVIRFSEHKDRVLRQLSIKSLAKFTEGGRAQPRVLDVLKKRLGDKDLEIKRSAAFALARIPDEGVVKSLVSYKDDPDGTIRQQVAVALGPSKHPDADTTLLKLLEDTHVGTRVAAIEGLRTRKNKAALSKLRFLVGYRVVEVQRAAIRATVELTDPNDWEKWWMVWKDQLYVTDPVVQVWAIRGVASQRAPKVPGLLQPLVLNQSEEVRLAALKALGDTGQKEAIFYVAAALSDDKVGKKTKMAALDALGRLNMEECGKVLMEFSKNEKDKDLKAKASEIFDTLP